MSQYRIDSSPHPWIRQTSRVLDVALTRLRIGHASLTAHLHRLNLTPDPMSFPSKHKDGGPPEALRMSYRRPDGSVRRRAAGNLLRGSPAGRSQRPARASGGLTEVNLPPAAAVRRSTAYVGPPVMSRGFWYEIWEWRYGVSMGFDS
ncbi:hypothetical protein GWK47_020602 [Chionoecetes opilio]|uniref:Uncharacterized protein n=1 Tax=Chionoecetes opilio TaxID=41210 RepID=A0A8J4XPU2_CHIOP|nr:hypothetical protein GWK47_020602 [Chionoecetes opilio]